jgi:hypothetical protein
VAEPPAGLAALFAKKPAALPSPAARAAAPVGKAAPVGDFFAGLAAKAPTRPVAPSAPPAPFVLPEIYRRPVPAPAIDLRGAATEALSKTGYFDDLPGAEPAPPRPFASLNHTPEVSRPAGLFKGLANAGPKPKGPPGIPKPRVVKAGAASLKTLFDLPEEPTFRRVANARRDLGVIDSHELKRILAIERRPPVVGAADTPDMTPEFRKPGGTQTLWPAQSAALYEARKQGGLLAPINVGGGKTLISVLIGSAVGAQRIVLLVKPSLKSKLVEVDIPKLSQHWKLPLDRLRVVKYSQLSLASSADILEEIKPDLIVADEAHELRHRTAARTKRFLRYMKEHPECGFVGMSGTLTRRSLKDYQHLSELALRKNSPLPLHHPTLEEWADALDVGDEPMAPGALLQLCTDAELQEVGRLTDPIEIQHVVRGAFRRRLVETPGVVATEETAVDASLTIEAVRPPVPRAISDALDDVRKKWEIDGEELLDALSVARVLRQVAAGFYYKWKWPNDEPDTEWLNARRDWFREVREILKRSRKGLDSPLLIANACERGDFDSANFEAWRKVKDRKPPPVEAIWIDDFLVKAALAWAHDKNSKPGILWYSWRAVGEKLAQSGLPFFGPGEKASAELIKIDAKKHPIIIASIKAHGTGKDLQGYANHLVTTPPSGGVEWEQLLGRSHRPGQLADEVDFKVYVHTLETEGAFRNAVRDAGYIESTTGQKQKLNYSDRLNFGKNAFDFSPDSKPEIEGLVAPSMSLIELLKGSIK